MKDKILALLAELKGGNYSAFDEFYHLTYRLFYVIGYGILKRKDLTEEALQEAYVSIYKNIDKINLQANVMSYLYTIVKNKSLNVLKKQREDQVAFDETVEMFLGDRNLKPFKDGDLFLEIKKVLNEQEYEIVVMSLVKGFKRREIAEMTNSNTNTVTWRYQQAMKKLKTHFEGVENEFKKEN